MDPQQRALLAQRVHQSAFTKPPFGSRGYDEEDTDVLLDEIEGALTGGDDAASIIAIVQRARIGTSPFGKRGYSPAEVDELLDEVVRTLGGQPAAPEQRTPNHGAPADKPGRASAVTEHEGSFFTRLFRR